MELKEIPLKRPKKVEEAILRLSLSLRDFIKSTVEDESELPTLSECKEAAEETYANIVVEFYESGNLETQEDIEAFIYEVFNCKENYALMLKFSTKATILHAREACNTKGLNYQKNK